MAASAARPDRGGAVGALPPGQPIRRVGDTEGDALIPMGWAIVVDGGADITASAGFGRSALIRLAVKLMSVHETARANMIESQLRPNKVTDERVIDAFARCGASCSCRSTCAASPMSTRTCRSAAAAI
jgi:hypothetical protein